MESSKKQIKESVETEFSQITIEVVKQYHEFLKGIAEVEGMTVNEFIEEAIDEKLQNVKDELSPSLVPNLVKWLKAHGHIEEEIVDCIMHLADEEDPEKDKTEIDDYKDRMTSPIGAVRIDPVTRKPIEVSDC